MSAGVERYSAITSNFISGRMRHTLPAEKSDTYILPHSSKSTPLRLWNREEKKELDTNSRMAPSVVISKIFPLFQLTATSLPLFAFHARPDGPARAASFVKTVTACCLAISTRYTVSASVSDKYRIPLPS